MNRQNALYSDSADYSSIPELKREDSERAFLEAAEALLWRWVMVLFALNVFAAWVCSNG